MPIPKIIIADSDINYITPIQLKFIEELFDKVELEVITEPEYFDNYFSHLRNVDILIVSEELYDRSLTKQNIGHIFLMTEEQGDEDTAELSVNRIYKYTSIKEIFNEITGKSNGVLNVYTDKKKESEIILVYSANGGSGKTTVAMGISACLSKNYKKVLYINASDIHNFQRLLNNPVVLSSSEVYASLLQGDSSTYSNIKHIIRKERFFYLPPFKTALLSLGISYSLFRNIAIQAKQSEDYDYIVVDADSRYDEDTADLINCASKVIMVTNQTESSVFSTNTLISNLNGIGSEKYIFICNDFQREQDNALISPKIKPGFSISEYIDHFNHYDKIGIQEFEQSIGIQKTTFLII